MVRMDNNSSNVDIFKVDHSKLNWLIDHNFSFIFLVTNIPGHCFEIKTCVICFKTCMPFSCCLSISFGTILWWIGNLNQGLWTMCNHNKRSHYQQGQSPYQGLQCIHGLHVLVY
jgi:hypothetical protein